MIVTPESTSAERRDALNWADHALRLEGLRSSEFAAPLFERLARGEITPEELRAALERHYRRD